MTPLSYEEALRKVKGSIGYKLNMMAKGHRWVEEGLVAVAGGGPTEEKVLSRLPSMIEAARDGRTDWSGPRRSPKLDSDFPTFVAKFREVSIDVMLLEYPRNTAQPKLELLDWSDETMVNVVLYHTGFPVGASPEKIRASLF